MAHTDTDGWNENYPAASESVSYGDNEIVFLRGAVRTRLLKEHVEPAAANAGGEHLAGSAKVYIGDYSVAFPTQRPDAATNFTADDLGRIAYDTDSGGFKVLTNHVGPVWTPLSPFVQVVNVQDGSYKSCPTAIPEDDTIPQITEGTEVMSRTITPLSATNKLKIDVVVFFTTSAGTAAAVALFEDADVNAIAVGAYQHYGSAGNHFGMISFTHYMDAGGSDEITFSVRAGDSGGGLHFNGHTGARKYGDVLASSITITEIVV